MNELEPQVVGCGACGGRVVLGGGGCGGLPWQLLLWGSALEMGLDFVTDNDAVFDLFEDGAVTAAE